MASEFFGLVKAAHQLAPNERSAPTELLREMFQTAQWAQGSEAAQSLAQMAARGAKGDPELAGRVRERQDLVGEWEKRDALRSAAVAQAPDKRDREAETINTSRLAAIDMRIADIDKRLAADFPDYAALASPTPLSVEVVQTQLRAGEALVLFLDTPEAKPTPEVGSNAAVKLTTRTFAELKAHPEIGRAEAFRLSMKELIEKGNLAEAHPSQWAPFVVVGEGAASK